MSPKSEPVQSYFALRILKSFAITYKGGTLSEVRYARPGLGSLFPGEGLALLVDLHSVAFDTDLRRVAHGPIGQFLALIAAISKVVHRSIEPAKTPKNTPKTR